MRYAVSLLALLLSLAPAAASAEPTAWLQWQHIVGVVDVAGPRSDGKMVAVATGKLYLLTPDGSSAPFAQSSGGYTANTKDDEAYLAVAPSPALHVQSAGCDFSPDDVFILDIGSPQGVDRVDPTGKASRFASIPNVDLVNGITFDTTGRFDHRLLVTAATSKGTRIVAIDCAGAIATVTDSGPAMEGGIVVAPDGFGAFGGQLIGPDENSGKVWAVARDGTATEVIAPDLPAGGDTGVESLAFVAPGFSAGGSAYLADRATADNPFPGNDSLLRLSSAALAAAGVGDGDLLVATEGGGTTVDIRCDASCTSMPVAQGTNGGHIEGHIALVVSR
ncbi:MAG: hypothetical protein JO247_08795 [Chloroflexi bacterium]|nr:hypothetical protein [Chloroflexota bacterium]